MSLLFQLLLCHPLVFLCQELFLCFMVGFATSVSDFLLETLWSRRSCNSWAECALFTLLLLFVVLSLHLQLPKFLLLLLVLQLHPFDRILIHSVQPPLILWIDFILNLVPAFFVRFKCTVFVNCQSMLWFSVDHLVVQVFIHSLFLILAVIWDSIHFASHEEVWFFLIDAWLVPVSSRASNVLWVVDDGFISVLECCWLSLSTFLARCTTSWSYVLLFIVIIFYLLIFIGILAEVVIFIVINQGWGLRPRILVLRVSLRLIGLKAPSRRTCSLSTSASRSHSVWPLIIFLMLLPAVRLMIWISILPMPTGDVLCLPQVAISLIKVVMLIIVWGEIVSINIKIDRLIVLQMWLLRLIISCNSTLSALFPWSTKRDLRWHHPVLNHIVGVRIILTFLHVLIIRSIILHSASSLWPGACSSCRIWVCCVI